MLHKDSTDPQPPGFRSTRARYRRSPNTLVRARRSNWAASPPQAVAADLPAGRQPGGTSAPGAARAPAERDLHVRLLARLAARVALVALLTVLAAYGALSRLWLEVRGQTPSAYLLAALLGGVALLISRARPDQREPDIHDRQIDYLLGIALFVIALFVLAAMPARLGIDFWVSHADLLAMPVLLAGATAVVFGSRALWRVRLPLLVLAALLVPMPRSLVQTTAQVMAAPALAAVATLAPHLPGWQLPAGAPAGLLVVQGPGGNGVVSFAGALGAGAGGLAGLVLVVFGALMSRGRAGRTRRVALLLAGWLLVTALRVAVALGAGSALGGGAARALLGPVGDMAVLVLAAAMLGFSRVQHWPRSEGRAGTATTSTGGPGHLPLARAWIALALVILACAGSALLDNPPAAEAARPRIQARTAAGYGSPISLDLLRTPSVQASVPASAIADCYGLTRVGRQSRVDLGQRVDAQLGSWRDRAGNTFMIVTWEQPQLPLTRLVLLRTEHRTVGLPGPQNGGCAGSRSAAPLDGDVSRTAPSAAHLLALPTALIERLIAAQQALMTADAREHR